MYRSKSCHNQISDITWYYTVYHCVLLLRSSSMSTYEYHVLVNPWFEHLWCFELFELPANCAKVELCCRHSPHWQRLLWVFRDQLFPVCCSRWARLQHHATFRILPWKQLDYSFLFFAIYSTEVDRLFHASSGMLHHVLFPLHRIMPIIVS